MLPLAAIIILLGFLITTQVNPVSNEPINTTPPETVVAAPPNPVVEVKQAPVKVIKTFRVTAYTGIDSGQSGSDITASGTKAVAYKTMAANPSIPFGTVLVDIKTGNRYTVEDRGGAIKGDKLDLFVGHSNIKEALNFGVQYMTFEIQ